MVDLRKQNISTSTSIMLDVQRIVAALVVLVFHVSSQWTTAYPATHEALGKASHAAVVVFFVISSYVIAFTTSGNNRGPQQYAIARLSRLYSVLVPALVVTALVEFVVVRSDAFLTVRYVREYSWLRYVLSAFFGNEAGLLSAAPPLNSPLWSLSYEFWYYLIYGLWFYRAANRKTWWWLAAASLIAGPKILLLMPIWLCEVWAFRLPKPGLVVRYGWVLVGLFLLLAGLAVAYLPALPGAVGAAPLFMTAQFATDWVVGGLVGLAIWSLPGGHPALSHGWVKPLRRAADLSFPLYVLHFPLIVLWRVVFGWRVNDLQQMWQVVLGVGLVAGGLGVLFENQRPRWIRFFEWLLHSINSARAAGGK
ncbi:acyltransferase family protein [Hymenobacter terrenus]|uniref:acyltransferase family protein n=1 Tax=Hymenobacter terrenus TaxID=1629124 RepID=UPI000619990B|nr:acyltransferase [Hymenobacter terrenus]